MLKTFDQLKLQHLLISALVLIQVYLIVHLPLFGDEAFYWLEGQHLDWSYSEIPGWTAWMIRLSTELFGNNYFAVRWPGFFSYLLTLYFAHSFSSKQNPNNSLFPVTLVLSTPLLFLIVTMALPDVWMLSMGLSIILCLNKAQSSDRSVYWLASGMLIAIAINIHVRMWLWLFIAATTWLWCMKDIKQNVKKAMVMTLPIAILGLIPLLIFNIEYQFPILEFQLSERQPWEFQAKNLLLFFSQVLLISPFVLYLWFRAITSPIQSRFHKWVKLTASIHFIFYIIASVFADGLRTNVHWLLISYVPILVLINSYIKVNRSLRILSIATGLLFGLMICSYLILSNSYLKSRWVQNSSYWPELKQSVEQQLKMNNTDQLIVDHFMTAAELSFEFDNKINLKTLEHPLNYKHGRHRQLEIMGYYPKEEFNKSTPSLLVLEDNAIKLQEKDDYYAMLCETFNSLSLTDTLQHNFSKKQYHIFISNQTQSCNLPPVFYLEHLFQGEQAIIRGWVLSTEPIDSIELANSNQQLQPVVRVPHAISGFNRLFPKTLKHYQHQIAFETKWDRMNTEIRIKMTQKNGNENFSNFYLIE